MAMRMRRNKYTGTSIVCVENTTDNGMNNSTKNGINKSCFLKSYTNGYVEVNEQQKLSKKTQDIQHETKPKEMFEKPSITTACLTFIGFYMLMLLGYINQMLFKPKTATEKYRDGYPPLYDSFERFYLNYVYRRIKDCWNSPVSSVPGAEVVIKDRITRDYGWTFELTGTETKCLNLGSYNYLGFAENNGPCAHNSMKSIEKYGISTSSPRSELGTLPLHLELESLTAKFLGAEDAITFGMGFATNALNIPTLLSPGCLVISDEKNHASLILGIRLSGATTKVFKHNNMKHLEKILSDSICYGQPNKPKYTPWKKIIIVVEGIYSMEGSIVKLPEIIALKKKYKSYLYLDEAHSIGAMGPHGRGISDYYGCNPKDIDILMGTFTKSFGSAGGYIAGSKKLINFLRANSHAHNYAFSMAAPVAQQIITSMRTIMGLEGNGDGKRRLNQLVRNTRYFRRRLHQMGLIVYGHEDSPVVPILVYLFSKIGAVVRLLKTKKIATVGVGFPATPLMEGRIRICLSASHTKEQLDHALEAIEEVADLLGLKYSRLPKEVGTINYEDIAIN